MPVDLSISKLCYACRRGDLSKVKNLYSQGIDINQFDHENNSPIYLAALCGHYDIVLFLLENGVICDPSSFEGERTIYAALNDKIRDLLKEHGFSVSVQKSNLVLDLLVQQLRYEYAEVTIDTVSSDFEIVFKDSSVKAQKCVLMAFSRVFRSYFMPGVDKISADDFLSEVSDPELANVVKFGSADVVKFGSADAANDAAENTTDYNTKTSEFYIALDYAFNFLHGGFVFRKSTKDVQFMLVYRILKSIEVHPLFVATAAVTLAPFEKLTRDLLSKMDITYKNSVSQANKALNKVRVMLIDNIASEMSQWFADYGQFSIEECQFDEKKNSYNFELPPIPQFSPDIVATYTINGVQHKSYFHRFVLQSLETFKYNVDWSKCEGYSLEKFDMGEVSSEFITFLANFLYGSEEKVPIASLVEAIEFADFFDCIQLRRLTLQVANSTFNSEISDYMRTMELPEDSILTIDNISTLLRVGWQHNLETLALLMAKAIAVRIDDFLKEKEFQLLVQESHDSLQNREEEDTIELIDDIQFYLESFVGIHDFEHYREEMLSFLSEKVGV